MNSLFQLEIPKRGVHCFQQGERLLPGMEIYSLLLESETDQITRQDFCSICWSNVQIEKIESLRGYWKSKIDLQQPVTETTRISKALKLLHEMRHDQEVKDEEIFFLCLFLSHARQLALRQEFQKEGISYQLYEILSKEEFITVKLINLSHVEIETIQRSLASKLLT